MSLNEPTAVISDKDIRAGLASGAIAARLFVKRIAGSEVDTIAVCGAGERALGVSMQAIVDTERGNVQTDGQAIVTAAGVLARAVEVASDAAGKAVAAGAGDVVLGITRSASLGADEDIEIEMLSDLPIT